MLLYDLVRKELKEIFRDKKNLILNLVFPIIMIMVIILIFTIVNISFQDNKETYLNIAIMKDLNNDFKNTSNIIYKKCNNLNEIEKLVRTGQVEMGVFWDKESKKIMFIENEENKDTILRSILRDDIKKKIIISLIPKNIIPQINILSKIIEKDYSISIIKLTAVIGSYILILLTMRLNNSNAYYLSTNEKSTGTLEVLLSAPISIWSIISSKWIANFISCLSLAMFFLLTLFPGFILLFENIFKTNFNFWGKIPFVILEVVFFAIIFSLLQLTLGFKAESNRQAQVYLVYIPLMLAVPLSVIFGIDLNSIDYISKGSQWIDYIPVVNCYSLIKMTILSSINFKRMAIIFGTNILILIFNLLLLFKTLKNESILYYKN